MSVVQKLLLSVAIISLPVAGYVSFGGARLDPIWTIALPLGVVSLGIFYLTVLLHNEAARFDEEERLKHELADRHRTGGSPPTGTTHDDTHGLHPRHVH
jgi:hypothetical protein